MEIKYGGNGDKGVPIAFIDNEGDLWFRTTNEENSMDNIVSIISIKSNQVLTYCDMDDFIEYSDTTSNDHNKGNYAVKTFFKGDSITITF